MLHDALDAAQFFKAEKRASRGLRAIAACGQGMGACGANAIPRRALGW